jgi:hypothetical protein
MKMNKKIIGLTLVITMLLSAAIIVNAKISEEKILEESHAFESDLSSDNETDGAISWTEPKPIPDNSSENSSGHNNQNGSWVPKPDGNGTETPSENETVYENPVLELFTIQNKGFNGSALGVKETRWLNDTSLLVNVGVIVNCGLDLVKGSISLNNLTLNLMYEIKGNESNMLRCNNYFDLYYIISNIEQEDFINIQLVQILNLR